MHTAQIQHVGKLIDVDGAVGPAVDWSQPSAGEAKLNTRMQSWMSFNSLDPSKQCKS